MAEERDTVKNRQQANPHFCSFLNCVIPAAATIKGKYPGRAQWIPA